MHVLSVFPGRLILALSSALLILASPPASAATASAAAHSAAPGTPEAPGSSSAGVSTQADAVSAAAPSFTLDLKQSWVHAIFKRVKVPLTGVFRGLQGELEFDPDKPAAGHAQLVVDSASLVFKDAKLTREALGPDWLDAEHFPQARFVSSAIVAAGGGKYSVTGKLTLHGKTLNVVVPMSYTQVGATRVFDGMLPIRRLQFGVGSGTDAALVADTVMLDVHLVTRVSP